LPGMRVSTGEISHTEKAVGPQGQQPYSLSSIYGLWDEDEIHETARSDASYKLP
jgi:hypothetical protein